MCNVQAEMKPVKSENNVAQFITSTFDELDKTCTDEVGHLKPFSISSFAFFCKKKRWRG